MRVLVVGASRGSGLAVVRRLQAEGHEVTAFGRTVSADDLPPGVRIERGDVADASALGRAVAAQDAVVVTLGISDNAMKVRLLRRAGTPLDVRSAGTRAVVTAMRRHGVDRLVVQTTYGAGESFARLPLAWKATFLVVLHGQLRDSERQEDVVRSSGLAWTLIRPVALDDDRPGSDVVVSSTGDIGSFTVSRAQVAGVVAEVLGSHDRVGQTLAVSA
jgi:nucleoside-diphosphate-sugar epimerase